MKKFIQLNLLTVLIFAIGLISTRLTGLSEIQLIGALILVFFLPAWNISFLLFPKIFRPIERISLALTSSFIVFSTFLYLTINLNGNNITTQFVLISTSVFYFTSLLLGWLGLRFYSVSKNSLKEDLRPLYGVLGLFVIATVTIFKLYPFIPEADPYTYLTTTNNLLNHLPGNSLSVARPFFTALTTSFSLLAQTSPYVLFKYLLPLFGASMLIPFYLIAKTQLKSNWAIFLATIIPISAPIIMSETVITRPQLTLMIVLPGLLYLFYKSIAEQKPWLSFYGLILAILLVKFHELSILIILIALLVQIITVWPSAKRQPKLALAFLILILVALYPHLYADGIISRIIQIGSSLIKQLFPLHFKFWFINHYVNADGTEIGWPGFSWINYYGYNLGIYLPVTILALIFLKKNKKKTHLLPFVPIFLCLGIFFTIAEIMPRFGLAYLPDRAWPFIILPLGLCLPILLKKIEAHLTGRILSTLLILSVLASLAATFYINYQKQGWVTQNEYQAAQFLKSHTPGDSIIVSQGGNSPLVNYFADRELNSQNIFTQIQPPSELKKTLSDLSSRSKVKERLNDQKQSIINQLAELTPKINDGNDKIKQNQDQRKGLISALIQINDTISAQRKKLNSNQPFPIYVLYSRDKFTGLYGQRAWWKTMNSYNANLDLFNSNEFKLIYNKNNVLIWQFIN